FLFHSAFLHKSAKNQSNSQNRDGKITRIRLVDEQRHFDRSMTKKVPNMSVRSQVLIDNFRSVEVAPRLVAIAPTTPTAYRSARPDMSLTIMTSSIGTMVASNIPALGTPHLLRR